MELYLIRHGQSFNNALDDLRDRVSDPPLTELGKRQADEVARHVATGLSPEAAKSNSVEGTTFSQRQGFGITKLYCSAMRRALQTAQPIGEAVGIRPEVWIDIHEKGGIYLEDEAGMRSGHPGLTRAEVLAEFAHYHLPEEITESGWWTSGYEDWPGCQGRAIRVAHELRNRAANSNNERIALVSHGGFIDALLKGLCDQLPSPHIWYHHFNTAITRVDFRENSGLSLRYINRVDHLPPDLIS